MAKLNPKDTLRIIKDTAKEKNMKNLTRRVNNLHFNPTLKESNILDAGSAHMQPTNKDIPRISWKPSRTDSDAKTFLAHVDKLDASWQKDKGFHVGPGGQGQIRTRYQDFGKWLHKGEAIGTPEVGLNYRGDASFGNGRHRFAYLRDQGVKHIPITVPTEHAEEMKKRFGVD